MVVNRVVVQFFRIIPGLVVAGRNCESAIEDAAAVSEPLRTAELDPTELVVHGSLVGLYVEEADLLPVGAALLICEAHVLAIRRK